MTRLHPHVRWLLFGGVSLACVTLLVALPRDYSIAVFGLIAAGGFAVSLRSAGLLDARWSRLALFAACGLMIASAYAFRPAWESSTLPLAALLMLLGWVTLVIGLRAVNSTNTHDVAMLDADGLLQVQPSSRPHVRKWRRRVLVGVGVLLLAMLAISNGDSSIIPGLTTVLNAHVQFALLAGGIVLVVWGVSGEDFSHFRLTMVRPEIDELAAVGGMTVLALVLRFWQLGESMRVLVHETAFADAVTMFWMNENKVNLLLPMTFTTPLPYMFAYLQSLTVEIFGHNLVGLRATSAIFGALTVPALYFLAKTLFDRKTALIAALLLATFPPHLQLSRLGILEIADPFLGALALAFLARGLRSDSRLDYALAGAMLGLTHYFHEGGRLLYTPLALLWLLALAIFWRQKPSRRGVFITVFVTALVAFPVYYTLLSWKLSLMLRMDEAGVGPEFVPGLLNALMSRGDLGWYLDHLAQPFLFYVHAVDQPRIFLYYGGAHPLIQEWLVPVFLLGVGYLLYRWRSPAGLLLLPWIVGSALGNGLMGHTLIATRYRVVFPALMLAVALAIRYLIPYMLARRRTLAMGVLTACICVGQAAYYFGPHLALYNVQIREAIWRCGDAEDAVLRAAELPADTYFYIISAELCDPDRAWQFLHFLNDSRSIYTLTPDMLTPEYIASMPADADKVFFVEPNDGATLAQLRTYFDLAQPQYSVYARPEYKPFVMYAVRGDS